MGWPWSSLIKGDELLDRPNQRTVTIGGSITIRLVSSFTSTDLTSSLHTNTHIFSFGSNPILLNWIFSVISFLIPITITFSMPSIWIEKSGSGVLGIRTWGRKMVGADETTEQYRYGMLRFKKSFTASIPLMIKIIHSFSIFPSTQKMCPNFYLPSHTKTFGAVTLSQPSIVFRDIF